MFYLTSPAAAAMEQKPDAGMKGTPSEAGASVVSPTASMHIDDDEKKPEAGVEEVDWCPIHFKCQFKDAMLRD